MSNVINISENFVISDSLRNILKEFNKEENCAKYKPLTALEEQRLIMSMRENDETELRKRLIEHNVFLPVYVCKRYHRNKDYDALLQDAFLGLCHGAQKFDLDRGHRFCTYVYPWVKKYALMNYYDRHNMHIGAHSISLDCIVGGGNGSDDNTDTMLHEIFDTTALVEASVYDQCITTSASAAEKVEEHEINETHLNMFNYTVDFVKSSDTLDEFSKDVFRMMLIERKTAKETAAILNRKQSDVQYSKICTLKAIRKHLKNTHGVESFYQI